MTDAVQQAILDAASYLARNQPGSGADGTPGGSRQTDVVDTAIQSLLGARPENPRDFRTLLDRAFTTEVVQGHTETRYRRPTTGGALLLAGGGTLTGAQATIVNRAKLARDEIFANLDPLVPMELTPDPDAVRDVRSLIHEVVDQIVEELSTPGGPTIIRVNQLLGELAGEDTVKDPPKPVDADRLGGLLSRLAIVFGMKRENISSLDDERTFTSFVAIVSTVASLCFSWISDRRFLDPLTGQQPFLGTQLVQIERALAVVGQAVAETRRALERAEVELAEQDVPIDTRTDRAKWAVAPPPDGAITVDANGSPSTSIGSVLSWADAFARTGGNRLRYGGQDGIISFVGEASRLAQLVRDLQTALTPQTPTFRLTGRDSQPVLDSLGILADRIELTQILAARLEIPKRANLTLLSATFTRSTVATAHPSGGGSVVTVDDGMHITLEGTGFEPKANVTVYADNAKTRHSHEARADTDSVLDVLFPELKDVTVNRIDRIVITQDEDKGKREAQLIFRPQQKNPSGGVATTSGPGSGKTTDKKDV